MNDSERNKMIEKVRKLLALSQSSNENEAALAAEKAQAMLAEYNLSMADVATEDKVGEDFIIDADDITESVPWRRQVAGNVARMYFCSYFYTHRYDASTSRRCGYVRKDIHSFVGATHNIVVAKMMFQYLSQTVERLATEGSMQYTPGERGPYKTAFKAACARRLGSRIEARIQAARAGQIKTEAGTTLPALASLYDRTKQQLTAFVEKKVGELGKGRSPVAHTHMGGVRDGQKAGDSISLDQQISGKAGGHLLGRS